MRIENLPGAASLSALRHAPPVDGLAATAGRFWDMPFADEEAGQDKLRSAVEWGIFQRFPRQERSRGALLNLKTCVGDAFFTREGISPVVTASPDTRNMEAWMAELSSNAFDEVFALDFFQVHPDVEWGMREMGRVLKKGGTAFLNFYSPAHFKLADALPGPDGSASLGSVSAIPANTLAPEQAVSIARRHGLSARKVIPYSSFYGNSLWVGMMESRFRWERILDWTSTNRMLFDLALLLEETFVARSGTISAPKYMLIVQREGEPGSGALAIDGREDGWKTDSAEFDIAALAEKIGLSVGQIPEILEPHLSDFRNRVFLHHVWNLLWKHVPVSAPGKWLQILPAKVREEFERWHMYERVDEACLQAVRSWHRIPEISLALRHRRIPLGPGLEYGQFPTLLKNALRASGKGGAG